MKYNKLTSTSTHRLTWTNEVCWLGDQRKETKGAQTSRWKKRTADKWPETWKLLQLQPSNWICAMLKTKLSNTHQSQWRLQRFCTILVLCQGWRSQPPLGRDNNLSAIGRTLLLLEPEGGSALRCTDYEPTPSKTVSIGAEQLWKTIKLHWQKEQTLKRPLQSQNRLLNKTHSTDVDTLAAVKSLRNNET